MSFALTHKRLYPILPLEKKDSIICRCSHSHKVQSKIRNPQSKIVPVAPGQAKIVPEWTFRSGTNYRGSIYHA